MKDIVPILLLFNLLFGYAGAQTGKPKLQPEEILTQPIKTVTPSKTLPPTPIPTPEVVPAPISTPIEAITLPKFETEIVAELNLFRSSPSEYAKIVEDYLNTFDGKYFRTAEGVRLESFEGKVPVEELIGILKQSQALPEFKLADGLIKAAKDHSQYLVENNKTGHRGANGSLPDERVGLYGTTLDGVIENISYGTNTARDVVLTMLIDDGVSSRAHRKNLLNPQLKTIGLATGQNQAGGFHCVMLLTNDFISR